MRGKQRGEIKKKKEEKKTLAKIEVRVVTVMTEFAPGSYAVSTYK